MSAGKYNITTGDEGEFEPGSRGRVLKNQLGITRKTKMDEVEVNALAEAQMRYLDRITDTSVFTADLLCEMHRDWLGDIYPWAGRYRTVEMSKNGFFWPPAFRVADNMACFEERLLKTYTPFRARSIDKGALTLAQVHAEFLLIHPFREGNGRLARWLSDLMCLQAGFPAPDYGFVGEGSKKRHRVYLAAVIQGYERNYEPLAAFFREALDSRTNG